MKKLSTARWVALPSAVLIALSGAGCGGAFSSDDDDDSPSPPPAAQSPDPKPPATPAPSDPVRSTELIANPSFGSGLSGWVTQDAKFASNALKAGPTALDLGGYAKYALPAGKLEAGKSYRLRVKTRNQKTVGNGGLVVKFSKAGGGETIRAYRKTFTSTTLQDYDLEFTAPPYTGSVEVSIVANGTTRLVVESVSLKMRGTLSQTEPIGSTANSHVPAGYSLAFNDEFNGTQLNRDKWMTRYIYSGGTLDRLNDEQQRYRDNDNHQVGNGVLKLVARKVTDNDKWGINWESGLIRSDWTVRYGYFEARVKMPSGLGVWPAFWLNSDVSSGGRLGWPPEIDIFEFVNNGKEDKANMIHSGVVTRSGTTPSELLQADPGFNTKWTFWRAPFNFDEGWHTIGGEWTADRFTLFVDGKLIYSRSYQWNFEDGTPAGPAHILLNMAIGGQWAGRHGVDPNPQEFLVDWVRVYKKK